MQESAQTILLVSIVLYLIATHAPFKRKLLNTQTAAPDSIIDSCALIDGRIIEIVEAGFSTDGLVIPAFILKELQTLADGRDAYKRQRARFGLDIARRLQDQALVRVTIDHTVFPAISEVDDKLIALAKKLEAKVYTTDYNLAKVAIVEGVDVLNVNDLAQRLRPIRLPGEIVRVAIIQKGSSKQQGVGYLEDGTMIVVDSAGSHVGKTVEAVVDQMHQTAAGKMIFAKLTTRT